MIEELYDAYYRELLGYCAAMAGNDRTVGEDLVQETYVRAMTHIGDLEALGPRQRRAWLYRTARNLYIDRVRKLARETCMPAENLDWNTVEEDLSAVAVDQLVGRLPKEERALFIMRYFEGYHAAELGELFSLPAATVRSRLLSARRRIVRWLELG